MSNYWKDRLLQIKIDQEKFNEEQIIYITEMYKQIEKDIQKDINKFYKLYADNEGLTYEAVAKLLSKVEQQKWTMTLEQYRQFAIEGGYDKILNSEYYKSRISRVQALKSQIKFRLHQLANSEEILLKMHLSNAARETYYRNVYELANLGIININFARYDQRALDIVLNKPWYGSNFSKRIWNNDTNRLVSELEKIISSGIARGDSIDRMSKELAKRMDVAKNRAVTLIQSETAFVVEQASLKAYEELDVERYEYLATLETSTCKVCASLDTKDFEVSKQDVGVNYPPMHANCRCTTIPYFDDEFTEDETRWSRDSVTGKGKNVKSQSYDEWYRNQVSEHGRETIESIQKKHKNRASDKKQYKKYKDILGKENLPKSFDEFQEMKYNKVNGWDKLKSEYSIKRYKPKDYSYNKDGTIKVTHDWTDLGKKANLKDLEPFAVVQTKTEFKNETYQIDRILYDENGRMCRMIHSGHHNKPKNHNFPWKSSPVHGHIVNWYKDENGKLKSDKKDFEILKEEWQKHKDILGGWKE